jgi:hypothetical protein
MQRLATEPPYAILQEFPANRLPNGVRLESGEGDRRDGQVGERVTDNPVFTTMCGGQHTRERVVMLVREKGTP